MSWSDEAQLSGVRSSTRYDRMVPIADDLFDEHLLELEREGAPYAQDP